MRWKQFFTPVQSMAAPEAKSYMDGLAEDGYQLVDVRQPAEYEASHIPGARLMPLAELGERSTELDPARPTLVYCAIGGRSRVAAQMLAGKGFSHVINMAGGIKAWTSGQAVGPEDSGLELFSGRESLPEVLTVAYALESGLLEFYSSMAERIDQDRVKRLFEKLAAIEIKHQQRIVDQYRQVQQGRGHPDDLVENFRSGALEGGLTSEQYLDLYQPDLSDIGEVLSLAMAIEAQALDLYQRAAERAESAEIKAALSSIAAEERVHITLLGNLFTAETGERREP